MRKTSLWKYGRGVWLNFVLTLILLMWRIGWANNTSKWQVGFNSAFKGLNLGRAVMKHLKCYGKHMVAKHLAVLQYFSVGDISNTVTREWSTKHVLASAVLWCARDDLTALGSPWADGERGLTQTPWKPICVEPWERKDWICSRNSGFCSMIMPGHILLLWHWQHWLKLVEKH